MDIDYLLEREAVSLRRSRTAHSIEARIAHAGLARAYGRIARSRAALPDLATPAKVVPR
ncbi:hypothetical protein [Sphingomonas hengshuiensis]|uniref:hypothetical protein n=1 Tax=Sphingomonas hengshuiensis TaxID=1609977 RepID=UPI000AE4AD92|nr:hypothetical protein [Sphingomonas hengshuiensis]